MIPYKGEFYPDVFLAGAPKSGTTFLFHLLQDHTGICASEPKEPDFYLDDENPDKKSEKELSKNPYASYYKSLEDGLLHLDGSVRTIYQLGLVRKISEFDKVPKAIFVLREPASRILSSFQYTSNNMAAVGDLSFSQYVTHLLGKNNLKIDQACKNRGAAYSLRNELLYSNYSFFLKRWKNAIGAENMKVFLFEDLKENPYACYQEVCKFLGLKSEQLQVDLGKKNESVEIKNKFIHYILHQAYGLTGYRIPFKESLKKIYARLQHTNPPDKGDYDIDLARLKEYYKPLNDIIARDYGLDLSSWN